MTNSFSGTFLRFFTGLCVFLLVLSTFAANGIATDNKLIFHTDNPKDYEAYKAGEFGGLGTETNTQVLLRLDYPYDFAYMTTNRSMQFMAKGENICVVNRIMTAERVAKFIFSDAVNIYLTKQLFQSHKLPPLPKDMLDEFGAVYLPDVFARFPQRTIVVSTQISQGVDLDRQLDLIPARNKVIRNGSAHEDGVIRMFSRERADYILLFSQTIRQGTFLDERVKSYPIAKATMFQIGRFMCADTPYIREVLTKINSIIKQLHQDDILYQIHLKWLRKEDKQHFTRLYHQALGVD